jgi:hypothetical protein
MNVGQALTALPLAAWMRGVPWAYPVVETAHIVALAALFGSILAVDLRILGASQALPAAVLMRHLLPVSLLAFGGAAATGSLLFIAHADDIIGNRVFVLKMCLIGAAGINAAIFHTAGFGQPANWGAGAPWPARAVAVLSILIWIGVIACGRWIAYA